MPVSLKSIFGLEGRSALVTGSSRGIGAAIAHGLSAAGADVVLHGRLPGSADAVEEEIHRAGRKAWSISGDLSCPGVAAGLVAEAEQLTSGIDILVINASAQINATLDAISGKDFDHQVNANLRSTLELLQAALPLMADRGWGRIVNVGSVNQLHPKAVVTLYAATKAAQHNLIRSQAREFARTGVTLNTLAPGLVDTDRNRGRGTEDPAAWDRYVDSVNWMGRMGEPNEMVGAAVFLASEASSFMTGETILVAGGA